jgi:hypothetical protein
MKKNKIIPFKWLPGSWGLSGQVYKEAEASYYLKPGEDLDRELAKIRYYEDNHKEYRRRIASIEEKYGRITLYERDKIHAEIDFDNDQITLTKALLGIELRYDRINQFVYDCRIAEVELSTDKYEYVRRIIDIKFKHGVFNAFDRDAEILKLDGGFTEEAQIELSYKYNMIDEYTKDVKLAKLIKDENERTIALLEVEYKHGKMKKNVFEKTLATFKKEPWIGIIDHGFEPNKGINGVYFEFDWNNFWIEYLELNGYVGATEDEIVESWFSDVCNTIPVEQDSKVQSVNEDSQ